jgi:hypothetical protein
MISNNHHHLNTPPATHIAHGCGLNGRVQVQANVSAVMPMPNVAQQCNFMQLQQPSDSYKLKQLNLQAGNQKNSQQEILANKALARKIAQKRGLQLQGEIAMFNKNDNNTTKITDDHDQLVGHAATDSTILLKLKEFNKVLQEYPEFQLNADQLEMLDAIEKNSQDTSNANTKLAELLIDQDSGHGVQ